jgi:hypothetical protein
MVSTRSLEDTELQNCVRDTIWTRRIKSCLCDVGYQLGYYVCANRVDFEHANPEMDIAHHGEWLYDVTWIKYQDNYENGDPDPNSNLIEIPFAAECEWNDAEHVKEDFEKLLQARAGIRLMICDGWKRSNENYAQEVAERLANMVEAFNDSQSNDVILLATWKCVLGPEYAWNFRFFELGLSSVEPLEEIVLGM